MNIAPGLLSSIISISKNAITSTPTTPIDEEPVVIAPINVNLANEHANARMSITTSKNAVIYCRVSTPHQSTLDQQEHDCRKYCTDMGYEVIDVVRETGSAYKNAKQPELHGAIERHTDIHLVVWKPCRLTRNTGLCDYFIDAFQSRSINLECVTDVLNLTSPLGRRRFREAINLAQFESDQIAERVRARLDFNKTTSAHHTSRPSLPTTPRTPNATRTALPTTPRTPNVTQPRTPTTPPRTRRVPRSTYGYQLSSDRQSLVFVKDEQVIIKFIISTYKTNKNAEQINDLVRSMLSKLGRGDEKFEPFQIMDDNENIDPEMKITMNARNISDVLNLYDIEKRCSPWTASKVAHVITSAPNTMLSNLNI